MPRILALLLALLCAPALAAEPARLSVILFEDDRPSAGVNLLVDEQLRAQTNQDGAARAEIEPGSIEVVLQRGTEELFRLPLELSADESFELIVSLSAGEPPRYLTESSHQGSQAGRQSEVVEILDPGVLLGRVLSVEDGSPVANARIFISGTPLDLATDRDGYYRIELSPGTYSISVLANDFATQTFDSVLIESEQETERLIELSPAGLELPEFVVLEPFIEGSLASFVEERRTSASVVDILGAEQISRAGDSDAAGALRRVTGLTLVDGKFIFVRGLGERYSSALLNGAQIPSPDQTRRVVPLDLFPTEVLSGIVVQKTHSADMPGEFGGGTIQLRTRGVPESFSFRVQASTGYSDGTTGQEGLRYRGGRSDALGRDDGTRAAPPGLLGVALPPIRSEANAVLGRGLASGGYGVYGAELDPNSGFLMSVGDRARFGSNDDISIGFIASLNYSHSWDKRDENRRLLTVLGDGSLNQIGVLDRTRTQRAIDSGLFLTLGAEVGELHRLTATLLRLGQTTDDSQVSTGVSTGGNFEQRTVQEWVENALTTLQVSGEHSLPRLLGLVANWQYTESRATRDSPNRRDYRFLRVDFPVEGFLFETIEQRFDELVDTVDEAQLGFRLPLSLDEARGIDVIAGASALERDRASDIFRFRYRGTRPQGVLTIDQVLSQANISPTGLFLQSSGTNADFYTALQELDAYYLALDGRWNSWRAQVGARRESNLQEVRTLNPFAGSPTPEIGRIEETDTLPSASLTWAYSEKAQVRFGYSETLSRPDFRELSRAPFTDPVLDLVIFGNPQLSQTFLQNLDLRWEYYFSDTESFSVSLFQKKFEDPIELVRVPGTGELATLANAVAADNRGIELDLYRGLGMLDRWSRMPAWARRMPWHSLYLGANYAKIESQIDLGETANIIVTNRDRPLQGQSPYVGNLNLAYLPEHGRLEATLLYNVFGRRISEVGVLGLPDVVEEPFPQLDFNIRGQLPWQGWRFRFRVRNLLDPAVEFTQGNEVLRTSKKGRDFSLALEWRFQ